MKNKKSNTKLILKGIAGFFIYFFMTEFSALPFILLNIDLDTTPSIIKNIYMIILELIILLLIFLLFKDYIIKCFNDFKKNHKEYFQKYFKYWFLLLFLTVTINGTILLLFPNNTANNQEAIITMLKTMPVYTFIVGVIIAPFLEESVFRLSFRAIFRNKYLFIFISGLIFGAFHVVGLYETWVDLLYIIPYSVPGWIFAYLLCKTDNIFIPISIHFIHNGITISLQLLLIMLGLGI